MISIIFTINNIIKVSNSGKANMLYENDSIIFNLKINLNALVIPHAGHGILNIFLNMQGILISGQIKNINIIPIEEININILFCLFM